MSDINVLELNFLTETPLLSYVLLNNERREWVNEIFLEREDSGEFHTLFIRLLEQPNKFEEYFRMKPDTFSYILNGIKPFIEKHSNFRKCITPEERLAVTLRFLSTGMSYRSLAFSYRIAHPTIGQIVYDTCDSIWEYFVGTHMPFPTTESLKKSADLFEDMWNFPNCVASIDGKHVRIRCPKKSGSKFFNYKSFFSVILQGTVDAKCRFISVDVGAYGRQSDSGVFVESGLFQHIENGTFPFPEPKELPGTSVKLPYVILGDQGYPLKEYLMRPYPTTSENVSEDIEIYNSRHSRARKTVERAFGILVAKWRCLKTELQVDPIHVDKIVTTVCLLHNIIIDKQGLDVCLLQQEDATTACNAGPRRYNRSTREAYGIRDKFKMYFNGPGAVDIQYS